MGHSRTFHAIFTVFGGISVQFLAQKVIVILKSFALLLGCTVHVHVQCKGHHIHMLCYGCHNVMPVRMRTPHVGMRALVSTSAHLHCTCTYNASRIFPPSKLC